MKIVSQIQSVKVSLLQGMKISVPAKLLAGLAIAAILMTAAALPLGTGEASKVAVSDLGGSITDFEEPYTSKVNVVSDLGGGITDFEEPYTIKVSLLDPQNEQTNIFPEVDLP